MLEEIATFDPEQTNALQTFGQQCPMEFLDLRGRSSHISQSIEDYLLANHKNLAGFLSQYRIRLNSQLQMRQTVDLFREARALSENPEVLVRYQSGLDSELYKALREAQTWRLSTIDPVATLGTERSGTCLLSTTIGFIH